MPTLQSGIDEAGSAIKLLWRQNGATPRVPVVPPEITSWQEEQRAWRESVAFFDLSHHMTDLLIEGPDALRLMSDLTANSYANLKIGQAKQFLPTTADGHIITDGILMYLAENTFNLVSIGAAPNWVQYQAKKGGYDVSFTFDPDSNDRKDGNPLYFRYQIQGPNATAVGEKLFDEGVPDLKFFHFGPALIDGVRVNVLRHGMVGQPGFEVFGDWAGGEAVRAAILRAGEALGMREVGGLAYYTTGIEGGWIPTPLPAIFTAPELAEYREFVPLFSYEGMNPLHGSYYNDDISSYYNTLQELGYGRFTSFDHDYIGRDAVKAFSEKPSRSKVTLVWDAERVAEVFGAPADQQFILSYTKDAVEVDGKVVGMSVYAGAIAPAGTVHSLALVDPEFAEPGTRVEVLWGQHPGPTGGDMPEFARIGATVQPAPIGEYSRTTYRDTAKA